MNRFITFIAAISLTIIGLTSVYATPDKSKKAAGPVAVKEYNPGTFTKICADKSFSYELVQASGKPKVVVTARQNVIDLICPEVSGGVLKLSLKKTNLDLGQVKITIYAPTVTFIEVAGESTFKTGNINANDLKLTISGASAMTFDKILASKMTVKLSGASQVKGTGVRSSGNVSVELSGTAKLFLDNLDSKALKTLVFGVGEFRVANISCDTFSSELSGAAKMTTSDVRTIGAITSTLSGSAVANFNTLSGSSLALNLSGTASYKNKGLTSGNTSVILSGAAQAVLSNIKATKVSINASGTSNCIVSGTAASVSQSSSGLGKISVSKLAISAN